MTAAALGGSGAAAAHGDVVDAEFEVVDDGSRRARPASHIEPGVGATASAGMSMLRQAADAAPRRASPGTPLFWITGIGIAAAAFWTAGGHVLLRPLLAEAAATSTPAALSIVGVTSRVDSSGRNPILLVDGEADNDGEKSAVLPPLEIHVADNEGRVTRYTLGTAGRTLAPGEKFSFSSRLDVPKNGVTAVKVAFAE